MEQFVDDRCGSVSKRFLSQEPHSQSDGDLRPSKSDAERTRQWSRKSKLGSSGLGASANHLRYAWTRVRFLCGRPPFAPFLRDAATFAGVRARPPRSNQSSPSAHRIIPGTEICTSRASKITIEPLGDSRTARTSSGSTSSSSEISARGTTTVEPDCISNANESSSTLYSTLLAYRLLRRFSPSALPNLISSLVGRIALATMASPPNSPAVPKPLSD